MLLVVAKVCNMCVHIYINSFIRTILSLGWQLILSVVEVKTIDNIFVICYRLRGLNLFLLMSQSINVICLDISCINS